MIFRNLAWLQKNIVDSPALRLAAVGVFAVYCVYLLHPCCWLHERFGVDEKVDHLARDAAPLLLVAAVIAFFYYLRVTSDRDNDARGEHQHCEGHSPRQRRRGGRPRQAQPHAHGGQPHIDMV
jgi:hypothetical protein